MNNKKFKFAYGFITGLVLAFIVLLGVMLFSKIFKRIIMINSPNDIVMENKEAYIEEIINTYYTGTVTANQLQEGKYKGMLEALNDPYSVYMTKTEYDNFMTDTNATFGGIGVTVMADKEDGSVLIVSVIKNGPSYKAGILAGDKIMEVNGNSVTDKSLDEVVSIMRGKEGTTVDINVYRESTGLLKDYTIIREIIEVPTVEYYMMEDKIGYIQLASFDKVSYNQFKTAYDDLTKQGQKAMILDLRFNGGGLLSIAEQIADELVPQGPIVYLEDKQRGKVVDSKSDSKKIEVPLVVLVNEYSASASEVLTGAIKDYNVGEVVGTTTFGKGVVQTLVDLPDGSGIKITIGKYYTPSGVCIHGVGIEPDYVVEMPEELRNVMGLSYDMDLQFQKAVEVLKGKIQ